MCSVIGAVMGGATLYSAYTQNQAGKAQANAANLQAQNANIVAEDNAKSIENAALYNASVEDQNAEIADNAAKDAIQRGAHKAADERLDARAINARARAAQGSSGTVVDSGSNLRLLVDNAGTGEMNALSVMNNSEREAYGYKLQALDSRAKSTSIRYNATLDARNTRIAGKAGIVNAQAAGANYRYAGNVNAMSTLVTGGSNMLAKFG